MFSVFPLFWGEGQKILQLSCLAGTLVVEDFRLTEGGFTARLEGLTPTASARQCHPAVAIAQLAGWARISPEARHELLVLMREIIHNLAF